MSAHGEVSAECEDGLHTQDAAHVDIEGKGEYFTPNPFVMEKSAEKYYLSFASR